MLRTQQLKTCSRCGIEKPFSAFYKRKSKKDGHRSECKSCGNLERVTWRNKNREKERSTYKRYHENHKESRNKWYKDYRKENLEKTTAHNKVAWAIESGKLKRKPCEKCDSPDSHAHHENYNKPLEVMWLCPSCHGKVHCVTNN